MNGERSWARPWTLGLEGVTLVGVVAGVQGFLSGQFDPLVEQLSEPLTLVDGPALPALALGLCVGLPQAAALALGLRRHRRAPLAGLGAGAVLTGWVAAQLPLIGWTSPVQWLFVVVGIAETGLATLWLRQPAREPVVAV